MFGYTTLEEERIFHDQVAWGMLMISVPTYITLAYVVPVQPWGKTLDNNMIRTHTQQHSMISSLLLDPPMLPARTAWFLFEVPNLYWTFWCWNERNKSSLKQQSSPLPWVNQFLVSLFVLHYIQRSFIYPLLLSKHTKKFPLAVVLSAFAFTNING